MKTFDHVIVGTGQATGTLLGGLLPTRASIAVIEGNRIGGTCVNYGCTPTKTLVASARVAHVVRRAADFGIRTSDPTIDFTAVMSRMNDVRGASHAGLKRWIEEEDQVTLFEDYGSFVGRRTIRVGSEVIAGDKVYINVGTRARALPTPGLDAIPWLDNRRILDLEALPKHLIILGGSYIGLEFGQMFRRFGSRVTIVERGGQLMPREDADVAEAVLNILVNEGIDVRLNTNVQEVGGTTGSVYVDVESSGSRSRLDGSHVLLAVGRVPNSNTLNPGAAGIETDERGYIVVDDHCRTTADGVFALGDVNGHGAFTHTAVNDAEIVLDLQRGGSRKLSDRITTYALFIDPALGRVGMTEKEALASGRKILKASRAMNRISRAKEMGETQGFAKLLVDGESDLIVGASILGPGGDEIINMFAAYMYSGLPCHTYRKSVLVHPTISELMPWALDDLSPIN